MLLVPLKDLALELNYDKSHLRRFADFHDIPVQKIPYDTPRPILVVTVENAEKIKFLRANPKRITEGYFYIVQPIPEFDPNRLKLGFTINPDQRLSTYRCIAPTAEILETFPCSSVEENPAIEFITKNAVRLSKEVFQFNDYRIAVMKAEGFFEKSIDNTCTI